MYSSFLSPDNTKSWDTSALGKNRPFLLTKVDPLEEHDLPLGKEKSRAISSTPKACGLLFHHPRRGRVTCSARGMRWVSRSANRCAARAGVPPAICPAANVLPTGKSAPALAWCWVTFAEQSMVISRERRSMTRHLPSILRKPYRHTLLLGTADRLSFNAQSIRG